MSRLAVLSDAQWPRIEPMMPSGEGQRGRPWRDHRQVVEGIIHRYRTGTAWRDLPDAFGPWQTVWERHQATDSPMLKFLLAELSVKPTDQDGHVAARRAAG